MLFMRIITWPPDKRDEIIKIVAERVRKNPLPRKEGVQQIWWDIHGNRYFELVYLSKPHEPKQALELFNQFLGVIDVEEFSVIEVNEALEVLAKA